MLPSSWKLIPMVGRVRPSLQNHGLSGEVLDHYVERAGVEEIAHRKSAADLGNRKRGTSLPTDISKDAIALIAEQELGLLIGCTKLRVIDLWVYMTINQDKDLAGRGCRYREMRHPSRRKAGSKSRYSQHARHQ